MMPVTAAAPAPLPAAERPGSVPDASALSFLAALAGAIPGPSNPVSGVPATAASPAGVAEAGLPISQLPTGTTAGAAGTPAIAVPLGRRAEPSLASLPVEGRTTASAADHPVPAIHASPATDPFKAGGPPAVLGMPNHLPPSLAGVAPAERGPAPSVVEPAAISANAADVTPPAVDPAGTPLATSCGAQLGVTVAGRPAFVPEGPVAAATSTAPRPMPARPPTGAALTSTDASPPIGKDAGVQAVEPEAGGAVPEFLTLVAGKAGSGPTPPSGDLAVGGMVPAPETAPASDIAASSQQAQAPRDGAPQILPLSSSTGSADAVPATLPPTPSARPTAPVLAGEIVRAVGRGDDRLTVELQPAELGRVQVALSFDGEGRLRAEFAVDRPDTLQLLQRDAQALEESLGGGGLQLADAGLSFGLRRDRDGADPQRATPPHAGDPPQAAATQDPEAVRRRPATDRLLDLHV